MGWSCLRADSEALDRLMVLLRKRLGHGTSSNGYGVGNRYFYEIDQRFEDRIAGQIFDTVHMNYPMQFCIENGKVVSWPTALPSEIKEVNK